MCAECGISDAARRLVSKISEKNNEACHAMIAMYARVFTR